MLCEPLYHYLNKIDVGFIIHSSPCGFQGNLRKKTTIHHFLLLQLCLVSLFCSQHLVFCLLHRWKGSLWYMCSDIRERDLGLFCE
jgi:hypothetical protein